MTDAAELNLDLLKAEQHHLRQWAKKSRRDRPREREAARDDVLFKVLDDVFNDASIEAVRNVAHLVHTKLIEHGEMDVFFIGYPPDGKIENSAVYQQHGIDPVCYAQFLYPSEREREAGMYRHAVFNPANAPTFKLGFQLFAKPNKLPSEIPEESAKQLLSLLSGQADIVAMRRLVRAAIDEAPAADAVEFAAWFTDWRRSALRLFNRGTPVPSWQTHWCQVNQASFPSWGAMVDAFNAARHKLEGLDAIDYTVEVFNEKYKHGDVNGMSTNHNAARAASSAGAN